jgi:hypothetical protein
MNLGIRYFRLLLLHIDHILVMKTGVLGTTSVDYKRDGSKTRMSSGKGAFVPSCGIFHAILALQGVLGGDQRQ